MSYDLMRWIGDFQDTDCYTNRASSPCEKRAEGGDERGNSPEKKASSGVGSCPAVVGALARLVAGVARGAQRPGREVAASAEPP